jgi:hypothetical protein
MMKLMPGEDEDYWENPEIKKRNQDWIRRWPNYCTKCGGWGGSGDCFGFPYPYHRDGLCQPEDKCHRCGGDMTEIEDYANPVCIKCGWRYDDGLDEL